MRFILFALTVLPLFADVASWKRERTTFRLELTDGTAEIGWLSQSSFRFSRCWTENCIHTRVYDDDMVEVAVKDLGDSLEFETDYVHVKFSKRDLSFVATKASGEMLLRQSGPVANGNVSTRREIVEGQRFYGLGAYEGSLNLRGRTIRTARPLLISTARSVSRIRRSRPESL